MQNFKPTLNLKHKQGSRDGAVVRVSHLPPVWPGFNSWTQCHMWVEFVVGSRPFSEGFSLSSPVFLPPQKPTFSNFNWTWKSWREEPPHGFHRNSQLSLTLLDIFNMSAICVLNPLTYVTQIAGRVTLKKYSAYMHTSAAFSLA